MSALGSMPCTVCASASASSVNEKGPLKDHRIEICSFIIFTFNSQKKCTVKTRTYCITPPLISTTTLTLLYYYLYTHPGYTYYLHTINHAILLCYNYTVLKKWGATSTGEKSIVYSV